ncbi:hypothetical protein SKAU_G00399630 [Synaphobranchus kaupii]|uniref:Uncharacterized protein n=1 Tax=Synaphobranchus kaupii TaxID=118154 RepID=A0A9Q1E8S7_SYNKA|nr:hypothetical protein SKAU_G00399630 [Synaphobranchus kaupii]
MTLHQHEACGLTTRKLIEPHNSLKIPSKKRRRFTKTFEPLSYGAALPVQISSICAKGAVLHREKVDFNAEPPWQPS